MDLLANYVGHILISHGVKRRDLVGIYMDKSCEMFLAILGIHKAGGGYVPLDPAHPVGRIQTILELSGAKVVLTSKTFQTQLESQNLGESVVFLALDIHSLSPAIKPDVYVHHEDISHVLFTSGSTGTPKGKQTSNGYTG